MTDVDTGQRIIYQEADLRPGSIMVVPAKASGYPPTLSQVRGPALPNIQHSAGPHSQSSSCSNTSQALIASLMSSTHVDSSHSQVDYDKSEVKDFNSSSDEEVSCLQPTQFFL